MTVREMGHSAKQNRFHSVLMNHSRELLVLVCVVWIVFQASGIASAHELRIVPDEPPGQAGRGEPEKPNASQTPPARNKPTSPLIAQKEGELIVLGSAVEQETQLMAEKVKLLDEDEAREWLASFISSKPFNCPLGRKSQWVGAIMQAAHRNNIPLSKEVLGLVACVIAIESGFRADPLAVDPSRGEDMAALLARAEQELQQKAGPLLSVPPIPRLYAEYKARYYPKLLSCKTEGEVEIVARAIAEDLRREAAKLPEFLRTAIHKGTEKLVNVVRTKGSMQLNLIRARQVMNSRGETFTDEELTRYMYTIEGGVDVGVAALKPMFVQYAAYYATPGDLSWLFFVGMDYHYGPFSSRNMMEQIRIRDLSGCKIPLDGDFLHYDEDGAPQDRDSLTLQAVNAAFPTLSRDDIMKAFLLEKDPHYVYTDLHGSIVAAHRRKFGETPFAVIGELWMGQDAQVKHGITYKTKAHLNKLDRYLNSVPWD